MFLDTVINRKLKKNALGFSCLLICGDRGTGKSTVAALISDVAQKEGRDVYCQYPYKGAYKIPTKGITDKNGVTRYEVNKTWLYSHKFKKGSVIVLDESSTIWPARNFKNWTSQDHEFFNFIRKEEILLVLLCQYFDQIDLNVKRACDEVWFLTQSLWFSNLTNIESTVTTNAKVADKNTEILGSAFKRGARKVVWDVCEIPKNNYRFYRKPYYDKFDSYYVPYSKIPLPVPKWDDLINTI